MKALFAQPLSTLDVLPPGQTASIITITANVLQIGISEKLSTFIQSTTLVIAALVIAFLYSAMLTLVTCSGLVFIAAFYFGTVTYLVKGMKQVEHADRMSSAIASEAFGSIRMLAACGAEPIMSNRFAGWAKESRRRGLRLSPLVALQGSPGGCLCLCSEIEADSISSLLCYTCNFCTCILVCNQNVPRLQDERWC